MRNYLALICFALIGAFLAVFLLLPSGIIYADCSPASDDTNNTIVCDNVPAAPVGGVGGRGGNDHITNTDGTTVGDIQGDGDGGPVRVVVTGGNDVIINNGTAGEISGDNAFGLGGNDTITNNGVSGDILGDSAGIGGDDVITNNGQAGDLVGDSVGNAAGGADVIVNNGRATGIIGDGCNCEGTADVITNNAMVTGNIDAWGGDDQVNILFGSQVDGNIIGGEDAETVGDTITFTEVTAAIQAAISAQCPNPENCNINVNGFAYRVREFENMNFLLAAVIQQLTDEGVAVTSDAPLTPGEICIGPVKVFRLPNGDLEVYSGFDILVPNGFLVAKIPLAEQIIGGEFGNADAPVAGWTATLEVIDFLQKIVVRDAASNVVNSDCQW